MQFCPGRTVLLRPGRTENCADWTNGTRRGNPKAYDGTPRGDICSKRKALFRLKLAHANFFLCHFLRSSRHFRFRLFGIKGTFPFSYLCLACSARFYYALSIFFQEHIVSHYILKLFPFYNHAVCTIFHQHHSSVGNAVIVACHRIVICACVRH